MSLDRGRLYNVHIRLQHLYVLAMDQYRVVSSPPLNLYNLLIDVSYSLEVLTFSTAIPVSDVEQSQLMGLLGLHGGNKE